MHNKSCLYFLIFLVCLLCYKTYETSKKFDRLNEICIDQEQVIKLQGEAICAQSIYISELKRINYSSKPTFIH